MNSFKGKMFRSEKKVFRDAKTGVKIWQMTDFDSNHSTLYFTKTSFTSDSRKIIFFSQRSGYVNLYSMDIESGEFIQLTNQQNDIDLFSPCLSHDGQHIFYSFENNIRKVNLVNLSEEVVATFEGKYPGTLHMSTDGQFIVARLQSGGSGVKSAARKVAKRLLMRENRSNKGSMINDLVALYRISRDRIKMVGDFEIILIHLKNKSIQKLVNTNRPGITLISPDNRYILYHMYEKELWLFSIDGKIHKPLYGQNQCNWITHPNWLNEKEVIFIEWPYALKAVTLDGSVRTICKINAWHAAIHGIMIICDTTHPNRGLLLINSQTGAYKTVCYPNIESQWQWQRKKPPKYHPLIPSFIYDPFGSEWMHPHVSFSPDGNKIIYNSSPDGKYSQIHIASLEGMQL